MSNSSFYIHAKKSLGQNFLKDETVIDNIVNSANDFLISKDIKKPNILEIGPGTGMLTSRLLKEDELSYNINAVEKDHRAIKGLQETIAKQYPENFTLHDADILKFSPDRFDMCIGNIPYYITSDILMWLCANKNQFLGALFMVQDEVAERLIARQNTKEYSRLTIKMQLNFEIKKLFKVPKEAFVPAPKVNSAIILLEPKEFSFPTQEEESAFESFTTFLFSQRRKMLRRIFAESFKNYSTEEMEEFWNSVKHLNILETDRPESISPTNILILFSIYYRSLNAKKGHLNS